MQCNAKRATLVQSTCFDTPNMLIVEKCMPLTVLYIACIQAPQNMQSIIKSKCALSEAIQWLVNVLGMQPRPTIREKVYGDGLVTNLI